MTQLAALTYGPKVQDAQAVQALNRLDAAAQKLGATVSETDVKLNRSNVSFDVVARKVSETERAVAAAEKAGRVWNQRIEELTRAAQAEGVAQDRLAAAVRDASAARDAAVRRAVQGYAEEAQAAALARNGLAQYVEAQRAAAQAAEQAAARAASAARERAQAEATMGAGLGAMAPQFVAAQATAAMLAQAAAAEQLRAKFIPLAAEQQRYRAALLEVAQAERAGALSAREAAAVREQVKAAFAQQVVAIRQAEAAQGAAAGAADRLAVAGREAGHAAGGAGQVMAQAGMQAQDLAIQLQMGTSAYVAFAQQGSQLLSMFGTGGAIAGAALAFGLIGAQLLGLTDATDTLSEAIDRQNDLFREAEGAAKRYTSGIAETAEQLLALSAGYERASATAQRFEAARLGNSRGALTVERDRQQNGVLGPLDGLLAQSQGIQAAFDPLGNATGFLTEATRQLPAGLEELRLRLSEFRSEGIVTQEAVARLYDGLITLDGGSAQANRTLREVAAALMAATPEMLRLADAQTQGTTQFLALRIAAGESEQKLRELASAMGRVGVESLAAARSLAAVRAAAVDLPLDRMIAETERNLAVVRAAATGGRDAADAAAQAGDRQANILGRVSRLTEEYTRALQAQGKSEAEVRDLVRESQGEFVTAATRAVDAERARAQALERTAEGARGAARAQRELTEAVQIYESGAPGQTVFPFATVDGALTRVREQERRIADQQADRQIREAEQAQRRVDQQVDQFISQYSRDISRATVDGLVDGFNGARSAAQAFGRILRNVATAALDGLVVRPILAGLGNAVGLPAMFSAGSSLFGGAQAAGINAAAAAGNMGGGATAGSLVGQGGMLASGQTLYSGVTGAFAASPLFNSAVPFTGMGGTLNGILNTQLVAPSAAVGAAPGAGGFFANTAMAGEAGAFLGGGAAATNGITIGSALAPAAAIAGGAYGIYSGIQQGGVGGAVTGIGGAASMVGGAGLLAGMAGVLPGLAALGPVGLIAGAVLAIVGSLLPGQKPSSAAQGATVSFEDGQVAYDGNRRNFSQANRDEAERLARSVAGLEDTLQQLAGFGLPGGVNVGVDSARRGDPANIFLRVGGQYRTYSRDEDGARQMAEDASRILFGMFRERADQASSADIGAILRNSGDAEGFAQSLEWYRGTYQVLTQSAEAANQFARAMEAARKPFDDAIRKANELGLATDALNRRRDEELAKIQRQRDFQLQEIDLALNQRLGFANDNDRQAYQTAFAALAAERELEGMRQTLQGLGVDAEGVTTRLDKLRQAQAAQALDPGAAGQAAGLIGNLRSYVSGLRTGDAAPGTVMDRLAAAQAVFDQTYGLAATGDVSALQGVQGAAETLRGLAREVFGGGRGYADVVDLIATRLDSVAARGADQLTRDFMSAALREQTSILAAELQGLRAEVAGLRAETRQAGMRPAAA